MRIFLQTHHYFSLYGLYLFNWLLKRVFIDYLRIQLNNFIFMYCDNHILPTNTHKIRVNFIIVHIKLLQTSPVSYVPELDQWILATANDNRVHKLISPLAYNHIIDVVLFRNNTLLFVKKFVYNYNVIVYLNVQKRIFCDLFKKFYIVGARKVLDDFFGP